MMLKSFIKEILNYNIFIQIKLSLHHGRSQVRKGGQTWEDLSQKEWQPTSRSDCTYCLTLRKKWMALKITYGNKWIRFNSLNLFWKISETCQSSTDSRESNHWLLLTAVFHISRDCNRPQNYRVYGSTRTKYKKSRAYKNAPA